MTEPSGPAGSAAALLTEQRQAATRAVLLHAAVAARLGITITDVSCLGVLDKEGPMPAGHLAQRVGLSRGGAITAALDRLTRAGFLQRGTDPRDRRRVMIEIVRGEPYRALSSLLDGFDEDYRALIESYGEDETRLILDFVRRANAIVDSHATDLAPPAGAGEPTTRRPPAAP